MNKKRLNKKGFSLVEVVMAALLLTVVLAGLFASYRNANNLISLARSKLLALTWAQSLIEIDRADFHGAGYVNPTNWAAEALIIEKGGLSAVATANLGLAMQSMKVTITWVE